MEAIHHTKVIQKQRMCWDDQFIKIKDLNVGDWALLYDSRFKNYKGKLQTKWLGPYEITIVFPNGLVQLQNIDDVKFSLLVNGHWLKLYKRLMQKDDFLLSLQQKFALDIQNSSTKTSTSSKISADELHNSPLAISQV